MDELTNILGRALVGHAILADRAGPPDGGSNNLPSDIASQLSAQFGQTTTDSTSTATTANDATTTAATTAPSTAAAESTAATHSTLTGTSATEGATTASVAAAASGSLSAGTQAHRGISTGTLAAAVAIPLLLALLMLLGAFLCLRRRRNARRARDGADSVFLPAIGEKPRELGDVPPVPAPILLSRNDDVFRDTSSYDSRSQRANSSNPSVLDPSTESMASEEPHPFPYLLGATPEPSDRTGHSSRSHLSPFPSFHDPDGSIFSSYNPPHHSSIVPPVGPAETIPFADIPAPASSASSRHRPGSAARSFTSTLYSDGASVHNARQARQSVGGAHLIHNTGRDPFGDPSSSTSSFANES